LGENFVYSYLGFKIHQEIVFNYSNCKWCAFVTNFLQMSVPYYQYIIKYIAAAYNHTVALLVFEYNYCLFTGCNLFALRYDC
jgi:hypothetical protein